MPDFIDSAALFSDIYAAIKKIVLSGTDSLGFWFALHQNIELLTLRSSWILMIKTLFQRDAHYLYSIP